MNLHDLIPRPAFLKEFEAWASIREVRVAITGANGTLGSLLRERLANAGVQITSFQGDVTDTVAIQHWVRSTRPNALFHLAAVVPVGSVENDPIRAMEVNATSMLPLLAALKEHAPRCWLYYASTSHVYRSSDLPLSEISTTIPLSLYGATKLAGETLLRPLAERLSVKLCIGRIFSYFHERQDESFLIPGIVKRVSSAPNSGFIELRNTQSKRDFLHASMVVDALLHLLDRRFSGTVNIASGRAISVGEIAARVINRSGKHLKILPVDTEEPSTIVADVTRLRALFSADST
jgi:nucleoside-diphosphate-sugar epimerase